MNLFQLFTDIFTCREHPLRQVDARVKMILAGLALALVLLSRSTAFPALVFAACAAITLAFGIPPRLLLLRLLAPFEIALVLMLIQAFFGGGVPCWTLDLAGWHLAISREGIHAGELMAARVLGAMSIIILLSMVTPAHEIFQALRWFRFPQGWVEVAMLMYRYTFTLLDMAADMTAAQKLRLGYSGLRRSLESSGMVAGSVILRAVDQAVRTHEAMVLRGYRGTIPTGPLPLVGMTDRLLLVGGMFALGAGWWITRRLL